MFCPGVTLYAWLTGTLDPHRSALWGAFAGVLLVIAVNNFLASLKAGAVSTNAPIFRLNFTITAALAVLLLGETLSAGKLAALLCALLAVWLLLAERAAQRPSWPSIARVLSATIAMGVANFFYKVGLKQGALPETMVAAQAWAFCTLATLVALIGDRGYRVPAFAWRYAPAAAIVLVAGFVLLLHGLLAGPASVLVPVAQLSLVFTALLGALMFGEKLNTRKYAGLVVAGIALILFAVS